MGRHECDSTLSVSPFCAHRRQPSRTPSVLFLPIVAIGHECCTAGGAPNRRPPFESDVRPPVAVHSDDLAKIAMLTTPENGHRHSLTQRRPDGGHRRPFTQRRVSATIAGVCNEDVYPLMVAHTGGGAALRRAYVRAVLFGNVAFTRAIARRLKVSPRDVCVDIDTVAVAVKKERVGPAAVVRHSSLLCYQRQFLLKVTGRAIVARHTGHRRLLRELSTSRPSQWGHGMPPPCVWEQEKTITFRTLPYSELRKLYDMFPRVFNQRSVLTVETWIGLYTSSIYNIPASAENLHEVKRALVESITYYNVWEWLRRNPHATVFDLTPKALFVSRESPLKISIETKQRIPRTTPTLLFDRFGNIPLVYKESLEFEDERTQVRDTIDLVAHGSVRQKTILGKGDGWVLYFDRDVVADESGDPTSSGTCTLSLEFENVAPVAHPRISIRRCHIEPEVQVEIVRMMAYMEQTFCDSMRTSASTSDPHKKIPYHRNNPLHELPNAFLLEAYVFQNRIPHAPDTCTEEEYMAMVMHHFYHKVLSLQRIRPSDCRAFAESGRVTIPLNPDRKTREQQQKLHEELTNGAPRKIRSDLIGYNYKWDGIRYTMMFCHRDGPTLTNDTNISFHMAPNMLELVKATETQDGTTVAERWLTCSHFALEGELCQFGDSGSDFVFLVYDIAVKTGSMAETMMHSFLFLDANRQVASFGNAMAKRQGVDSATRNAIRREVHGSCMTETEVSIVVLHSVEANVEILKRHGVKTDGLVVFPRHGPALKDKRDTTLDVRFIERYTEAYGTGGPCVHMTFDDADGGLYIASDQNVTATPLAQSIRPGDIVEAKLRFGVVTKINKRRPDKCAPNNSTCMAAAAFMRMIVSRMRAEVQNASAETERECV